MYGPKKIWVIGIGSLLIGLPIPILHLGIVAWGIEANSSAQQQSHQLSEQQLRQLAQSITVKVIAGEGWGSGILIRRQGQVYTVLTNRHVLEAGNRNIYTIQTPDGQIYPANLVRIVGLDLGWISFRTAKDYPIASFKATSTLGVGEEVFAAGFPYDLEPSRSRGLAFTKGKVSLLSEKAFAGGYQIGVTNPIWKGMSGGPLLDSKGQVLGINGIQSYPLWGNPYVFTDGSVAPKVLQEKMSQLSWAIPTETFLQLEQGFSPKPMPTSLTPQQIIPSPQIRLSPLTQPPIMSHPSLIPILPKSQLW